MHAAATAVEPNRRGRSPGWYALWTHSHCERQVRDQLEAKGFDAFLPECQVWSMRGEQRVRLSLPLFPGYLFLRHAMDKASYVEVVKTRGLARILGERWDRLSEVPEGEVSAVRAVLEARLEPAAHPFLKHGQRVRIRRGPLAGVEGFLVASKPERALLVLSIELFCRSIAVEIDSALAGAA